MTFKVLRRLRPTASGNLSHPSGILGPSGPTNRAVPSFMNHNQIVEYNKHAPLSRQIDPVTGLLIP